MAATWADLIEQTRGRIRGLLPTAVNELAASPDASTTSLTLAVDAGDTGIGAGSVVEIGSELVRVGSVSTVTLSSCIRGWAGSTAAAHTSGDMVISDSSVTVLEIIDALNATMVDMTARGLHLMYTETFTPNGAKTLFEVTTANAERVWAVQGRNSSESTKPMISPRWQAFYNLASGIASSGIAVQFEKIYATGVELYAIVGRSLPAVGALTASPATDGLDAEYHDVAALGAAALLLEGEEANRNAATGLSSSRRGGEVPPGSLSSAAEVLRRHYDRRCGREAARLQAKFPPLGVIHADL